MSAIGLRVGPFEIRDDVIVPGTGSWYRAERTGLTRRQPSTVLVRLLGPNPSSRDLAGLQRQFDVLKGLDDARFPRPVALYEGIGALALDAELSVPLARVVEARLLGDVVMTPATLLDLGLDLAEALAYAHQKGRIHGHICPDNVSMAADGSLQIWGVSEPEARCTFAWLAPERARGEPATPATDQWSLGAMLVALVTGRTPWAAASAGSDPRTGDVQAFVQTVASQWPALGRLVRRMLDANAAARFSSLHAVRLELLSLARKAGGTSDRRRLGGWLHREFVEEVDSDVRDHSEPWLSSPGRPELPVAPHVAAPRTTEAIEVQIEIDEADDIAVIRAGVVIEPAHAQVRPERAPAMIRPISESPRIHVAAASRAVTAGVPGYGRALRSDAMSVVVPDFLDDVPVAGPGDSPPPVRRRTAVPAHVSDPDLMATEMLTVDPDRVATEMVRPALSINVGLPAPSPTPQPAAVLAALRVRPTLPTYESAATPVHVADDRVLPVLNVDLSSERFAVEPTPTMPGMDLPMLMSLDEVLPGDDLSVSDVVLAPGPVVATIEMDDDWLAPMERGGAITVVPFTDPVFNGPSLGLEPIEVDELPETDDTTGPAWFIEGSTDEQPTLGMPWERPPLWEHDLPRDFRIVRVAPWLASVATLGLVLLSVYNIAT
ncbi:MAG: hypothetical protein ACI9MC_003685 [Kiritimatiellia bacterium]|jgi:hypothetical protein